jgi:hypothetical protein
MIATKIGEVLIQTTRYKKTGGDLNLGSGKCLVNVFKINKDIYSVKESGDEVSAYINRKKLCDVWLGRETDMSIVRDSVPTRHRNKMMMQVTAEEI